MNWEKLADVDILQLERNEALLDSLYTFLEENELSSAEAARAEPSQLSKMLAVVQWVMKVKGEEAKVAMEELVAQQQLQRSLEGEAPNERALMNQIVQLEREVRERERTIEGLRERGSSPAHGAVHEARVLRQENEDLKIELGEVKRRLDNERAESDRLSGEAATERLKSRQLEREIDQLRNDLEEYHKHMKTQGGGGGVGASMMRAGEREYRERLRHKDLEIAEQLDKIEDLLNIRDDLENQRHTLVEELGRVEEQRIASLRETEEARQALIESERHCSDLETKTALLEGQVSDLRECLKEKAQSEEKTHTLFSEKTREWEAKLSAEEAELTECREKMQLLQSQLTEAAKDSNRATVIRMKKQLQERDQEVAELQEEMARGAAALEELSSQLEEERLRGNPTVVNTALQKSLDQARAEGEGLKQALEQEVERRETCEASSAEREEELTQALQRLGEYERGEYGLREAVLEIKTKKEEISIRDRDIVELTQQINSLDQQVNQLSEFNEMLCERLGVGEGEETGFAEWRAVREGERKRVEDENCLLRKELERVEEEKLVLRKQLLAHRHSTESANSVSEARRERGEGGGGGERGEGEGGGERQERGRDETDDACLASHDLAPIVAQLQNQVAQFQRQCVRVSRERDKLAIQLESFKLVEKERERTMKGERERELGKEGERERGEKVAKELKSTHRKLERKTAEAERLEKEVEVLRQAASGFQITPLPECIPMTSRDIIASLNEHLLHALKAERGRSQECGVMKEGLEKYQRKFSVIIHQQGILYKEYLDGRKEWEREREQLQVRLREMEAVKEVAEIHQQELKSLQEDISSDPDQLKKRRGELSRQITTLRVNEKTLSRRYTLVYESEATLRKENVRLRNDVMTLEKAATERIGFLERCKEAMLFKLGSLQTQLSQCVPLSELQKATRQHTELSEKYQRLLERGGGDGGRATAERSGEGRGEMEEGGGMIGSKLAQAQSRERELRERLTDWMSPDERTVLEAEVATLRKSEAKLKLEISQLANISDIARQQVVAMETWKKSHDLMMSSLHHELLDAHSQTDDKTIVGKLHLQLSALQISESEALRKVEAANVKILQLEASLMKCEKQTERMTESAFHARSQSQTKITQLQTAIQALRRRYAGAILLSEQEKQVELKRGLQEQHREMERMKHDTQVARDLAQERVAELEVQQSNLDELLAALKDPQNMSGKLMEWHAKLGEARLREMKAVRSCEKADRRAVHLESVVEESERKIGQLEQEIVQVTKEYESSLLSWEQRELELEQPVREQRQRETDQRGDTAETRADSERNQRLQAEAELSRALTDLQQKSRMVSELRREMTAAKEQVRLLEPSLAQSQERLTERERELSEMRLAVIQREGVNRAEWEGHRAELVAAERGRRMAEETVQQLQALVSQKDAQCDKYCQLLQEARSQLTSMANAHKSEVASLMKKLHAQSDAAILKLREVSMEAVSMPVVAGATEKELARLHELEDLIGQQRVSYEARLAGVCREKERVRQDCETSLAHVRQEMGELKTRHLMEKERLTIELNQKSQKVEELEQEIEVMSGELSAAQEAARQAPSKTMKSLVEKLRLQLSVKEKQQKALNEALLQVRAELLDATQKTIRDHTHHEVTEVNLQRMVQKRTSELEERVEELGSSLNGMRTELEWSRDREATAQQAAEEAREVVKQLRSEEERQRREGERWRREREEGRERVRQLEGDLQQSRRTMEQGRDREQRLARELQMLQQRSDHKPEVEELERKLKVLQTRFDRQKQQLETLKHQQKVVHVAVTAHQPPADEAAPAISARSSSSSESVLRWEENKKWQRKVDGLRSRLADKMKEAESAQGHVTSLKESLIRSDREKQLLQEKIKSLQKTVSESRQLKRGTLLEEHTTSVSQNNGGVGYYGDRDGNHTPSLEELQRVVSAMRSVVEKQQHENERLRREVARVREREKMEKERGRGGEGEEEKHGKQTQSSSSSSVAKLASENDRLQRNLKREMEQNERLKLSLKSSEIQNNRLKKEQLTQQKTALSSSSNSVTRKEEEKVEELRAELAKKTQMLLEVKTQLKEVAGREREREGVHTHLTRERDTLREQVAMLRKELDSFDPSFFEEVEDLKFNYQEAVRKNIQYEQHITTLSQQLGVSPPSFNT